MSASQSGSFNIQEFADAGAPLVGGRLYTYAFGTTTHKTAYTDHAGAVPHAYTSDGLGGQYIALNVRGELPTPLYLVGGSYDLALKTAAGATVWTRRADPVWDIVNDLSGATGSSLVGFVQAGTGAVMRTAQDKLRESVSVKDFGAKGDGVTDDTAAIQAALNSGAKSIFVPHGNYNFTTLTMPTTVGLDFYGGSVASVLVQKGAGIKWPVLSGAACLNSHSTIRDLAFDGTAGTANTVDTSYCQTLDLRNLFFTNIPTGFCSLKLDGNPTNPTYMHDVRVFNLRIYSTTTGNAGLVLGAYCSDTEITDFIMEGGMQANYCVYVVSGAQTTKFQNCHIYNVKDHVVHLEGNNGDFAFTNCSLDWAGKDVLYANAATNLRIVNTYVQAIQSGYSGIVLNNSYNCNIIETSFQTNSGAVSCVREATGSSGNKVVMGHVADKTKFLKLFDLTGDGSYAKGFADYNPYDMVYALSGCGDSTQAQNTAVYYGPNGNQPTENTAAWSVPISGKVLHANVYTTTTPAVGQTFVFSLRKNGVSIGTLVISSGQYGGVIPVAADLDVSAGSMLCIRADFSATSGASNVRYSVLLTG